MRDGNRGENCVSVGGNDCSLVVHVEVACSRVGDCSVGFRYLEEACALNRDVERVSGLVEVALRHDDFAGC